MNQPALPTVITMPTVYGEQLPVDADIPALAELYRTDRNLDNVYVSSDYSGIFGTSEANGSCGCTFGYLRKKYALAPIPVTSVKLCR